MTVYEKETRKLLSKSIGNYALRNYVLVMFDLLIEDKKFYYYHKLESIIITLNYLDFISKDVRHDLIMRLADIVCF